MSDRDTCDDYYFTNARVTSYSSIHFSSMDLHEILSKECYKRPKLFSKVVSSENFKEVKSKL